MTLRTTAERGRAVRTRTGAGVAAILVAGSLAVGCSTEEPLPPREGDAEAVEQRRRVGSLLAEFESAGESKSGRVEIHAQFLGVRGVEVDRARRALGVWRPDRELGRDTCTLRPSAAAEPPSGSPMDLDLLSVGSIEVSGPSRELELEARRLPDVAASFSGVIYGTERSVDPRTETPLAYEPGRRYTFRAEGDGSTGGFRASLEAPAAVEIEPRSGEGAPGYFDLALEEGRDFKFRWNDPEAGDGDVYFDISTGHAPDRLHLQCRLEDDGSFSVPSELVGQLAEASSKMRVSLRRVHSSRVDIAGLQRALVTVSAVDHLDVRLRQ